MKINYSADARQALQWIKLYHPQTGEKITHNIIQKISGLRNFPRLGMNIKNIVLIDLPDTYYLIVDKHIVIYEVNEIEKEIIILRIHDHRSHWKEDVL